MPGPRDGELVRFEIPSADYMFLVRKGLNPNLEAYRSLCRFVDRLRMKTS